MADLTDGEEEGGGAGWIVSYADLMTLLFAAFVVLYGITPQGKSDEIMGMISSIRESFKEIPDELPEQIRKQEMFQGRFIFKEARPDGTMNPAIKKYNRSQNLFRGRSREQVDISIILEKIGGGEGIHESLRQATEYARHELGQKLELAGKYYFKPMKSQINTVGQKSLATIAKNLLGETEDIIVIAHADVRSADHMNPLELSAARAANVRQIFLDAGFREDQIRTSAMGDLQPRHSRANAENDRVEIVVPAKDSP